jgi:hypothetical protein
LRLNRTALSGRFHQPQCTREHSKKKKFEWEASISQTAKFNFFDVLACDIAVRYKFSDHFSAGIAAVPSTLIMTDSPFNGIFYLPTMASLRYDFATQKTLSPYFILDAGGSFIGGFEGFQGRFGIGLDINAFDNCSLFTELGITTLAFELVWIPISAGIRF